MRVRTTTNATLGKLNEPAVSVVVSMSQEFDLVNRSLNLIRTFKPGCHIGVLSPLLTVGTVVNS